MNNYHTVTRELPWHGYTINTIHTTDPNTWHQVPIVQVFSLLKNSRVLTTSALYFFQFSGTVLKHVYHGRNSLKGGKKERTGRSGIINQSIKDMLILKH